MDRLSVERIAEASGIIDPVFRDSPQFVSEPLSRRLGMTVVLKVECLNPIRSFKGRGTDYLLHRLEAPADGLVCASAGNFGQGLAYAARKRGIPIRVYCAADANPFKVERMRALDAEVVLEGVDFDAAKDGARRDADATGAMFVEDGSLAPITEGAGTIALELCRMNETDEPLDAVMVPLGDGALVTGIGLWLKYASRHARKDAGRQPAKTRVLGVVAEGAPAMEHSWRAGKPVSTETVSTIADGIAVRVPVVGALEAMRGNVDEVIMVSDTDILAAMRMLLSDAGLVVEPAGAAGLAAAAVHRDDLAGARVAVIVTGGNITDDQFRRWLAG